MAKALKTRPAGKKHAGKALLPSRRRAPRKAKARGKPGATKRGAGKDIDQQPASTSNNERPPTAIAATNRANSGFLPLLPFWPVSPFAMMRMWWGR
jgi:hypothetical protein